METSVISGVPTWNLLLGSNAAFEGTRSAPSSCCKRLSFDGKAQNCLVYVLYFIDISATSCPSETRFMHIVSDPVELFCAVLLISE